MKKNQEGFVTIVLIVLIVAFTGAVAYFISSKKAEFKKIVQLSQPIKTTTITPLHQIAEPLAQPLQQNNDHLVIKEWSVEFKKPEKMQDIIYTITSASENAIGLSTQQLINLDKAITGKSDCTAVIGALGVLGRENDLSSFKDHYIPENIRIGDYYYFFGGPQAPCSDDKQVQQLQGQQITALKTSVLKTLKAASVNETADWKKYQNNKYWFSVKYPADWDVSALPLNCPSDEHPILDEYNQLGFVKGKEARTCLGPDIRGDFIIEVSTNYPQKIAFGGKIISSKETLTTIGGMPATMITGILLAGGELNNGFAFTSIIVKKDDYYFLINDSSGKTENVADTEYKAIFEKFLSTFEFSK